MTVRAEQPQPGWAHSPTYRGATGRAWRVDISRLVHVVPDTTATLDVWLLNVPGAHAFWSWWLLSAIHLRQIDGVRLAEIRLPGATHEIIVATLDPQQALPDPGDFRVGDVHFLSPIDVAQQYTVRNDADAVAVCELLAWACCDGILSPDQDFRKLWEHYVLGTAAHISAGGHGWPA